MIQNASRGNSWICFMISLYLLCVLGSIVKCLHNTCGCMHMIHSCGLACLYVYSDLFYIYLDSKGVVSIGCYRRRSLCRRFGGCHHALQDIRSFRLFCPRYVLLPFCMCNLKAPLSAFRLCVTMLLIAC